MLSGTACGLVLPHGRLAMALAMDAFPRFTLLALGAVFLLVTSLLATHKTLVVVVPAIPLCYYTTTLALSRGSCSSAAISSSLVTAATTDLASSCFLVRLTSAALASITAWSCTYLAIKLSKALNSCIKRSKTHPFLHHAVELEWLDCRRYCFSQHLAML